jgi:hypothetical protein
LRLADISDTKEMSEERETTINNDIPHIFSFLYCCLLISTGIRIKRRRKRRNAKKALASKSFESGVVI